MYVKTRSINYDFHKGLNYQKKSVIPNTKMFFRQKKIEPNKENIALNEDLAIITKMNQEFATSLDLKETLQTALEVIIKRIDAQAANIFLIDEKKQVFQCIASKYQSYLDEYEIPLTQGVMGKAVLQKKCIRVGDVRKDVREIAEFYFDLDNKTNFTTYSVLCSPLIVSDECIGVIHCLNKKTNKIKIKNLWIVRQFKNDYNPIHFHNGDISGVGYLKIPKNLTKGDKKIKTHGTIDFIYGSKSFLNNSIYNHIPKVGDLILFPNYLMHTAYPFKREGERRSFSFNLDIDKKTFNVFYG